MNYLYWVGLLCFLVAGALLHEVPFIRFIPAMMLITVGTLLGVMSKV